MGQVNNASTEFLSSAGGIVFSITELMQVEGINELLPYWGLIQGALNIKDSYLAFTHFNSTQPEKYGKGLMYCASGSQQLYVNSGFMLAKGSLKLTLFCMSMAVSAGVELAIAFHDYLQLASDSTALGTVGRMANDMSAYNENSDLKRAALKKAAAKLISFVGWTFLALSNPIGWYFVLAASLYLSKRSLSDLANNSLFKKCNSIFKPAPNRSVSPPPYSP